MQVIFQRIFRFFLDEVWLWDPRLSHTAKACGGWLRLISGFSIIFL